MDSHEGYLGANSNKDGGTTKEEEKESEEERRKQRRGEIRDKKRKQREDPLSTKTGHLPLHYNMLGGSNRAVLPDIPRGPKRNSPVENTKTDDATTREINRLKTKLSNDGIDKKTYMVLPGINEKAIKLLPQPVEEVVKETERKEKRKQRRKRIDDKNDASNGRKHGNAKDNDIDRLTYDVIINKRKVNTEKRNLENLEMQIGMTNVEIKDNDKSILKLNKQLKQILNETQQVCTTISFMNDADKQHGEEIICAKQIVYSLKKDNLKLRKDDVIQAMVKAALLETSNNDGEKGRDDVVIPRPPSPPKHKNNNNNSYGRQRRYQTKRTASTREDP